MKKISYAKVIAFVGIFIAMDILLTRPFRVLNLPFTFSFVAMSVAGAVLGPFLAALTAFLSDLVGVILFPQGQYFIGYGLTAVARAVIYGLFFYKSARYFLPGPDGSVLTAKIKTFAKVLSCSLAVFILNIFTLPLWDVLYINMFNKKMPFYYAISNFDRLKYWALFAAKLLPYSIQFTVQVVVMYFVFKYLDTVIKKFEI